MGTIEHAKVELKAIGMLGSGDEMNEAMCMDVMSLLEVFAHQGHSGFSAPYCIDLFCKLAKHQPLSPLTGSEDEWIDRSEESGEPMWQNIRASHVFKGADGRSYDIDAVVYVEPHGGGFTKGGQRHYIEFPYTPARKRVLVDFDGNEVSEARWQCLSRLYDAGEIKRD